MSDGELQQKLLLAHQDARLLKDEIERLRSSLEDSQGESERLTDEVERLREARKEPIHIGVGKVLVGLAYDEGDPLKIEREVVIHQIGRTVPVGDEVPELANSSTDDLDVLARIRIDDPGGSWLLMEKLGQAIENARRALGGEEKDDE